MELTKEYFDETLDRKLKPFATKDDLNGFATKVDLDAFATKDDLKSFATKDDLDDKLAAQTKELKEFAEEQTAELARIINDTVAVPLEDVKTRVTSLEQRVYRTY